MDKEQQQGWSSRAEQVAWLDKFLEAAEKEAVERDLDDLFADVDEAE